MLIAGGYANHAGYGGPKAGIPKDQGNSYTYGIEAENNGLGEPWSDRQLQAYYRLCAALLDWMGTRDVSKVFAHKEWAPGRKIDPAGINMDRFRDQVRKALSQGPSVVKVSLSALQPGKKNESVLRVKRRLARRGFFDGDVTSNYFGAGLREAYRDFQRHLGYTGEDADGLPGRESLSRLGFWVVA
jgi:N-acetyl-anhydromuramyl-L-alanine amidase AmpD